LLPLLNSSNDNIKIYTAKVIWTVCDGGTSKVQEAFKEALPGLVGMLRSKNTSVQASSASAIWSMAHKNTVIQDAVRETKGLAEFVDLLNWHTKDYLADPKANQDKGQVILAAAGAIQALSLKNAANKEAFGDCAATRALDPLKEVVDKAIKKEVVTSLDNLGVQVRSRTASFLGFLQLQKQKETQKDKEREKNEKDDQEEDTKKNQRRQEIRQG